MQGMRTLSMCVAWPLSSMSNTTPWSSSLSQAAFDCSGIAVKNLRISISGSKPPTDSRLPVLPVSVMTAVPPSRILSSPVTRAVQTAEVISEKLQLDVETIDCFTEIDFGPWRRLTAEEIERRWPREWRLWRQKPHLGW